MKMWVKSYCMEHHRTYRDMLAHLKKEKHRCKLYNPRYPDLCHYKNCLEFWTADGYCNIHRSRV